MSTCITPPDTNDCKWRDGPPPEIGWWPASRTLMPNVLRFYDGQQWSRPAYSEWSAEELAKNQSTGYATTAHKIKWTDRWWLEGAAAEPQAEPAHTHDAIDAQRYRKLRRALFFRDVLVQPHNEARITMRVSGVCPSENDIDATIDALPEVKA